jgi:hypothetical protein
MRQCIGLPAGKQPKVWVKVVRPVSISFKQRLVAANRPQMLPNRCKAPNEKCEAGYLR